MGMIRNRPASGLLSGVPKALSSSLITLLTSALCKVKSPTDIPAIQLTSNMSTVSSRWRSSSSVPERMSMLRRSSIRTLVASRTNGSSTVAICRAPM